MLQNSLAGIRVLDLSRILAGPWCTQNLADLGAEVIKIEHPQRGDDTRGWGPPYLKDADGTDLFSAYFLACNRGKKSVSIDFSTPEGANVIKEMAQNADILIENYRPGSLAKHGLDFDSLKKENPSLVYLSITGFGQTGPMAYKPGYDYVFQGTGGLMSYTGHPDGVDGAGPLRVGVAVVDLMTGMYATTAALAALRKRDQTGEGSYIDMALLDVAVALNANQASNYLVSGDTPQRTGNSHPNCAPYEVFNCADGHLILAIGNDTQFEAFCQIVEHPDLAQDPRYATNGGRLENMSTLRPRIKELLGQQNRAFWSDQFDKKNVPWGPICTLDEVFSHPQVLHRKMLHTIDHPTAGPIPLVRNPMLYGAAPDATGSSLPPPLLGEHTEQRKNT